MPDPMDVRVLREWVHVALAALGDARAEIDALNVFPVPDGDTGTNMFLTMEAASLALRDKAEALGLETDPDGSGSVPAGDADSDDGQQHAPGEVAVMRALTEAMVRGALLGARGNSGVILSQILRGLTRVGMDEAPSRATAVRTGLAEASRLAYAAVADPQEGTMLTVVRRAAEAAAEVPGDDLADVVEAAAREAGEALEETPELLPVLKRAGVVDSGGKGVVVVLEAIAQVVTGRRIVRATRPGSASAHRPVPDVGEYRGPPFEVMYLLDARDEAVSRLKEELAKLGDSLVVVGGDGLWNVHVHVEDAGAAIECGIAAGVPRRIRVTWLQTRDHSPDAAAAARAVICVAHGPGIVALLEEAGAVAMPRSSRAAPATGEFLTAVRRTGSPEVIILPSDRNCLWAAQAAASAAEEEGVRAAVVPTGSIVESLAAVAVHDPNIRLSDDLASMSRAAGGTRYGAVTRSTRTAMTTAGVCRPGDILGVVEGDILQIGTGIAAVSQKTLDRLLSAGGELITIVTGAQADPQDLTAIREHLRSDHPLAEVAVHDGGQPLWPFIFGVE